VQDHGEHTDLLMLLDGEDMVPVGEDMVPVWEDMEVMEWEWDGEVD